MTLMQQLIRDAEAAHDAASRRRLRSAPARGDRRLTAGLAWGLVVVGIVVGVGYILVRLAILAAAI